MAVEKRQRLTSSRMVAVASHPFFQIVDFPNTSAGNVRAHDEGLVAGVLFGNSLVEFDSRLAKGDGRIVFTIEQDRGALGALQDFNLVVGDIRRPRLRIGYRGSREFWTSKTVIYPLYPFVDKLKEDDEGVWVASRDGGAHVLKNDFCPGVRGYQPAFPPGVLISLDARGDLTIVPDSIKAAWRASVGIR